MSWIDFLIAGLILLGAFLGWRSGFIRGILALVTWLGGLLLASMFYQRLSSYLITITEISEIWVSPTAFFIITFFGIAFIGWLSHIVERSTLAWISHKLGNRLLGIIPGAINGIVSATIVVLLLLTLPLPAVVSRTTRDNVMANYLATQTEHFQLALEQAFGKALLRTMTIITVPHKKGETIELPFSVSDSTRVRADLETKMLELVNCERKAAGLELLEADDTLRDVARSHSADMFARSYFSHMTPEGLTSFDRMHEAGISFLMAGENIALAPTLSMAHNGLMNSAGHRANILRPQFKKVGIGIIDGDIYGLMITQLFQN